MTSVSKFEGSDERGRVYSVETVMINGVERYRARQLIGTHEHPFAHIGNAYSLSELRTLLPVQAFRSLREVPTSARPLQPAPR